MIKYLRDTWGSFGKRFILTLFVFFKNICE